MADYSRFSTEDFVTDAHFCEWVLAPTPESEQFWQLFLNEHPEQAASIQQAHVLVKSVRMSWQEIPEAEAQQSFRKLQSRLQEKPQPVRLPQYRMLKAMAVAATLLGIFLVAGWWYTLPTDIHIQTGFGETRTVQLPDGSTVLLNANSQLTYANNWSDTSQRHVQLEGEAFFKVSHHEIRTASGNRAVKFVVHADDINVEVVGTEFTVKNRHSFTQVALYKGKVQLQTTKNQDRLVMKPGETAEFNKAQGDLSLQTQPTETVWAWNQNKLIFKEATLQEVAQTLQDNYGLTLTFTQDSLAGKQFTGEVSEGKIEVLLTAIAETFDCKIQRKENQVILSR